MGIDEEGTSPRSRCAAVTYLIKKSRNTAAANPSSNCRSHTVNQGLSPRLVIVDYCLLRFGGCVRPRARGAVARDRCAWQGGVRRPVVSVAWKTNAIAVPTAVIALVLIPASRFVCSYRVPSRGPPPNPRTHAIHRHNATFCNLYGRVARGTMVVVLP